MNQSLSYLMLLAVGVMIVGPLMLHAQSNITSNIMSVHDFFELQEKRVAQTIIITHSEHRDNTVPPMTPTLGEIHIHAVNTGIEDIIIKHVLIDGIPIKFESSSSPCWVSGDILKSDKGYCLYTATKPKILDSNEIISVDSGIRIGIQYEIMNHSPITEQKTIQLVTDAFKLFEITVSPPPDR